MFLSLIFYLAASTALSTEENFRSAYIINRENKRLAGQAVKKIDSSSLLSCSQTCLRYSWCTSTNFKECFGKRCGTGSCELHKQVFSTIQDDTKLNDQPGSTFSMFLKRDNVTPCDGEVTCINGCCKNNPCQNGGTCTEICEPTSVRYNCSCPAKFIGRHCEFERKSCQAYKAAGERKSELYTIIDDSDRVFKVFCDFDSEPNFAWNLIQSFKFSNNDDFKGVIFSDYNDADATSGDQPNWHAYLIRSAYLAWLGAQSTHWRATCRYDTDGVVYTDYMRTSLADCNILTMQKEHGTCFQFEFINIRGHECFNCTVPLWNEKRAYSLHTDTYFKDCEFDGKTGSVYREDNFGHYVHYNSLHRCSSGSDSTTQFWLGGK